MLHDASVFSDYSEVTETWKRASAEAVATLRILRLLRDVESCFEVDAYLRELTSVVDSLPLQLNARDASRFIVASQLARNKLLNDATNLPLWSAIVRAFDPSSSERRVPERFIRREATEPETSWRWTKANLRVYRTVKEFAGSDADLTFTTS